MQANDHCTHNVFVTPCCQCSSSISSQQMQSCIKYKSKCVQPRFSLRYQINKISIQCTSESVFLYEIKKSMKINAIKHQNYISRLPPQIPSKATVCMLFFQNFAGEAPRKQTKPPSPPPPRLSGRAGKNQEGYPYNLLARTFSRRR